MALNNNYGVDQFGKPVGSDQTASAATASTAGTGGCPPGQSKDQNGNCRNTSNSSSGAQAASLTGNTQTAQVQPTVTAMPGSTATSPSAPQQFLAAGSLPTTQTPAAPGSVFEPGTTVTKTGLPVPPATLAAVNAGGTPATLVNPNSASSFATTPPPPDVASAWASVVAASGLQQGNQSDPNSMLPLVQAMQAKGYNVQLAPVDSNGHSAGIIYNGQIYQTMDGNNNLTALQPFTPSGNGGGGMAQGQTIAQFLAASGLPSGPSTPAPAPYALTGAAPSVNIPAYAGTTYAPAPTLSTPLTDPTTALIQQMLGSGGSMNPSVVAQMKEQQKSGILDQASQLKQQELQSAAGRGVSPTNLSAIDLAQLGDISKAYSGIDIAAAQQNQADKLAAINASQGQQSSNLAAFLGQGNLGLSTEQSQAAADQAAAASGQSQAAQQMTDYLNQQALGLGVNNQAFQQWLAAQGLGLNFAQLGVGAYGNNQANQLAMAQFLAGG